MRIKDPKLHLFAGEHKIIPQAEDPVRRLDGVNTGGKLGKISAVSAGGVWVAWNEGDKDFYRWADFDKHVEVLR